MNQGTFSDYHDYYRASPYQGLNVYVGYVWDYDSNVGGVFVFRDYAQYADWPSFGSRLSKN